MTKDISLSLFALEAHEARLVRDLTGPSHGVDRVSAAKQLKAVRAQLAAIGGSVEAGKDAGEIWRLMQDLPAKVVGDR